jgi:hypothetical protein
MLRAQKVFQPLLAQVHQLCIGGKRIPYELARNSGKQDLSAMSRRHNSLAGGQRGISRILVFFVELCRTGVDPHSYPDRRRGPSLVIQVSLCFEGCIHRIKGGGKGCAETVSDNLKDISVVRADALVQDLMVPCQKSRHFLGILLGKFRAAFDVSKKKGDRTGGYYLPCRCA